MGEILDKHRSAKNALVAHMKDQGVEEGYSVGISLKGVEIRFHDDSLKDKFPEDIEGVPVVVVEMASPPTKRNAYPRRAPRKK